MDYFVVPHECPYVRFYFVPIDAVSEDDKRKGSVFSVDQQRTNEPQSAFQERLKAAVEEYCGSMIPESEEVGVKYLHFEGKYIKDRYAQVAIVTAIPVWDTYSSEVRTLPSISLVKKYGFLPHRGWINNDKVLCLSGYTKSYFENDLVIRPYTDLEKAEIGIHTAIFYEEGSYKKELVRRRARAKNTAKDWVKRGEIPHNVMIQIIRTVASATGIEKSYYLSSSQGIRSIETALLFLDLFKLIAKKRKFTRKRIKNIKKEMFATYVNSDRNKPIIRNWASKKLHKNTKKKDRLPILLSRRIMALSRGIK